MCIPVVFPLMYRQNFAVHFLWLVYTIHHTVNVGLVVEFPLLFSCYQIFFHSHLMKLLLRVLESSSLDPFNIWLQVYISAGHDKTNFLLPLSITNATSITLLMVSNDLGFSTLYQATLWWVLWWLKSGSKLIPGSHSPRLFSCFVYASSSSPYLIIYVKDHIFEASFLLFPLLPVTIPMQFSFTVQHTGP